jgi:hypothetical protein
MGGTTCGAGPGQRTDLPGSMEMMMRLSVGFMGWRSRRQVGGIGMAKGLSTSGNPIHLMEVVDRSVVFSSLNLH